jgi:DoxX-like family
MSQESPKWMRITGIVLSALPALGLVASAAMKLTHNPGMMDKFNNVFGYPESLAAALGIVELLCAVLYAVPATAVLGAILMTGYLGGAVATHVRVHDVFIPPLLFGILVWVGLFLRDARLRQLLPLRQPAP